MAVTIVDYLYITLAILGIGKLLERKKIKKVFAIISSIILIIFGLMIIKNITSIGIINNIDSSSNLWISFISVFFLTISSPMTIVFFTSLFATKAIEYNYNKNELLIF
jgi:threonine/homoserine/homoserine lactone efflux protein